MIRTLALSAAALLATGALITGSAGVAAAKPKPPPPASASFVALPATVKPVIGPDGGLILGTADVKFRYRCVNDATTRYFLLGSIDQPGSKHYSGGARNGPGSYQVADCNGKVQVRTFRVYTTPNFGGEQDRLPYLRKGTATLTLTLASRAEHTGGYYGTPGTGPSVTSTRTVNVTKTTVV